MISEGTALQVAVTAFPLIALVATYAVDSIRETDSVKYRILVLVLGLGAVATVAPAIFVGLAGPTTEVDTGALLLNLGKSVGLVLFLTVAVMLKESLEGQEDQIERLKVLLGTFISLIIMFQVFFPGIELLFGL